MCRNACDLCLQKYPYFMCASISLISIHMCKSISDLCVQKYPRFVSRCDLYGHLKNTCPPESLSYPQSKLIVAQVNSNLHVCFHFFTETQRFIQNQVKVCCRRNIDSSHSCMLTAGFSTRVVVA